MEETSGEMEGEYEHRTKTKMKILPPVLYLVKNSKLITIEGVFKDILGFILILELKIKDQTSSVFLVCKFFHFIFKPFKHLIAFKNLTSL